MTKNMFFYTRTEGDNTFTDGFNINKVIRAFEYEKDKLLVLLDDSHEEYGPVTIMVKGKPTVETRKQDVFSQISLIGEDITRFHQATAILQGALDLNYTNK